MAMSPDDYPGRTPRRLVLAERIPDANKVIMYDPSAFYFGYLRGLTRTQRRQALKTWQNYWSQNSFNGLFSIPFLQRVYTKKQNSRGYIKEEKDMRTMPFGDLEWAIQQEIRSRQSRKFKAAHLWNRNGWSELFGYGILQPSQTPVTGSIITTAMSHSDSSARNSNVPRYRLISVQDLFGDHGHFITGAHSDSEDFFWSQQKEGRIGVVVPDKHIAALMYFARHYPERIQEYDAKKGVACLPFDMSASFEHANAVIRDTEHFPDARPPRNVLIMDIFLYWLFKEERTTMFEVSKNLMQMPFLMDPSVIAGFKTGDLRLEVLTQGYAKPDIAGDKLNQLRKLYSATHTQLTREGFSFQGFTLEFHGTEYEAVAYNYAGIENTARIIFDAEYRFPPLVLYTNNSTNTKNPERLTRHPIDYIARGFTESYDEWTKKRANILVEAPDAFIPEALIPDYKDAIDKHYEGGIEQFKNNVTARYMYGYEKQKAMGRKLLALVRGKNI